MIATGRDTVVANRQDTEATDEERAAMFAEHRRYLFAVAYRMLGVAADAEDTVQDAWMRFAGADAGAIENPRTYLVTIVTRLCIDLQRSARKRREQYVGVWLPEPVRADEVLPDRRLERAESASFAFLLLLERLSPLQRAVLVLYDVFDYSHAEIARAIDSTAAASRQALRRARRRLEDVSLPERQRPENASHLIDRFLTASRSGDVDGLLQALAPDVALLSDGGGRVAAIPRPLTGHAKVGRFFAAVGKKADRARVVVTELNGQPALRVYDGDALTDAYLFDVTGGRITTIYVVRNPEKLARLDRSSRSEPTSS